MGTGDLTPLHSASGFETRNPQADRMAYFSALCRIPEYAELPRDRSGLSLSAPKSFGIVWLLAEVEIREIRKRAGWESPKACVSVTFWTSLVTGLVDAAG